MVEELKLAIKIDDASIEQSLLKQFANAQKMADKVVLDFKNVNFDDKQIEAKFKEMQKKAGQNPIDLSISGNTLDMLGQIDKRLTEIFSIGKGKSFIDSYSTVADIGKIENKINELNKKYEEAQKKLSSIGSDNISGKNVNLVDNEEFKKLSQEVSELKNQFDDLKAHMQLLDDYTVPTDRFFELQSQVETTTVKVSDLVEEFAKLSNAQKALSSTPQESNISSAFNSSYEASRNNNISDSIKNKKEALASYELQLEETRYEVEKLSKSENKVYGFNRSYDDKKVAFLRDSVTKRLFGEYDPSSGKDGSKKWLALGRITNIDTSTLKSYQMWQEELQKVGYTLSEIKQTSMGLEADIIPIDGKAITNAEEFRKTLDNISTTPSENVQLLNKQITDLESKISSLKSEIASLESPASNQRKDAFPDKDVSASVESATNSIKEENNVLEQNTQKIKENTQAKEHNANVNLNKYDKRLDSYQGKINKYDTTIKRFEDGGWTSDAYLENVQAVKNAVHEYETLLNELKGKDASLVTSDDISKLDEYEKKIKETIATVTNMSAAEKGYNFVSGQKELDKIHKLLAENSKMSSEAKAKIKAYYAEIESGNPSMSLDKIHGEILKIYNAEVEAGRAGRTLWDTLKNSGFHQIAAQMAGMIGVYDIINIFKQGANTLKEFDDSLTKISYTMDMTKSQLDNLGNSVLDMSSDMKSSIDDAMQVAQIYANMQTSAEEIQKLSEPTLILSNLSGFDASTVADDIQAASQQFDIAAEDSMHIADVYDYISRNIQVDYSKGLESMAEGLQVAGSTAKQAGLDLEQTTAIIAKAVEKTRLEGSQVGNGLKTILTRLSKVGELSDEVDNETLSKASESLHQIGIEVYNVDGSYRQFDVIMGELAEKWDGLTDAEKSNLSYNIAATRQTNLLSAILSNFSDSMQLAEEATNANGSAIENQQKYMESFSGHLQSLETEAKIAWLNILDSETLKDGVDLLTGLVKVVGQLVDTFGLLGTTAGIGGIVAGFKNVGIDTLVAY